MSLNDLSKYKDTYLSEAKEHVASVNNSLIKLEKSPKNRGILNSIFREIHTLKSMSATMHYVSMASLCHAIEDVLDIIKKKKNPKKCFNILFKSFDTLELSLNEISDDREELDTSVLLEELRDLYTIDEKLGSGNVSSGVPETEDSNSSISVVDKVVSIEVKVEKLDLLMNLTEELLINKMRLDKIKEELQHPELKAVVDILGRQLTDIQYNVMQARMVPVSYIFNRFPRLIRDLAKSQNKDINLELQGTDIELDRGVIDEISESLVHLIKNAIDHGLEIPDTRRKAGKPPHGTIRLVARRNKGLVVIEISDDGAGLNLGDIKNIAMKRGIISEDTTEEEIANSIFSGVSTTKQVTQVSGRGYGVNIVKENIESIGGSIRVVSEKDACTKFVIEIPLTIAIIKCLFVKVAGRLYAIPVVNVVRLVNVNGEDIKGMLSYEAVIIDEENIPVIRLDMLFKETVSQHEEQPVVIVRKEEEVLGLAVDSFLSTQDVVVKPLNKLLKKNKHFAGFTIVGSGEVVSILDVANLVLTKRALTNAEKQVKIANQVS